MTSFVSLFTHLRYPSPTHVVTSGPSWFSHDSLLALSPPGESPSDDSPLDAGATADLREPQPQERDMLAREAALSGLLIPLSAQVHATSLSWVVCSEY